MIYKCKYININRIINYFTNYFYLVTLVFIWSLLKPSENIAIIGFGHFGDFGLLVCEDTPIFFITSNNTYVYIV